MKLVKLCPLCHHSLIPRPLPPHSQANLMAQSANYHILLSLSCQIHRLCQPFSCAGYQLKMDGYVQERAILGAYGSATELSGWQSNMKNHPLNTYLSEYSCLSHTTAPKPTNSSSNRFTYAQHYHFDFIMKATAYTVYVVS